MHGLVLDRQKSDPGRVLCTVLINVLELGPPIKFTEGINIVKVSSNTTNVEFRKEIKKGSKDVYQH